MRAVGGVRFNDPDHQLAGPVGFELCTRVPTPQTPNNDDGWCAHTTDAEENTTKRDPDETGSQNFDT